MSKAARNTCLDRAAEMLDATVLQDDDGYALGRPSEYQSGSFDVRLTPRFRTRNLLSRYVDRYMQHVEDYYDAAMESGNWIVPNGYIHEW